MNDEPLRLTLEEALRLAEDKDWAVTFTRDAWKGVYVGIADGFGDELSNLGTWEESFSEALGRPVADRDPARELRDAVRAMIEGKAALDVLRPNSTYVEFHDEADRQREREALVRRLVGMEDA